MSLGTSGGGDQSLRLVHGEGEAELYASRSRIFSREATINGVTTCPATLVAVRIMSRIGSMAISRPTPSSGSPSVDSVRVSMTVAPVRPAVAAEPITETNAAPASGAAPLHDAGSDVAATDRGHTAAEIDMQAHHELDARSMAGAHSCLHMEHVNT